MPLPSIRIDYLSEYAVCVQFGDSISEITLQRITSFAALLQTKPFAGYTTVVPAYTTLSVFYQPLQVIAAKELAGNNGFEKVSAYLQALYQSLQVQPDTQARTIIIPVCYGGVYGPDLNEVAVANKLTPQEVITAHTQSHYKVFMMGFVPGFAYLGGMDERIATHRKTSPRAAVPARSVGIGGRQTGIYSLPTPGGWQIIGRTPYALFDVERPKPSLLQAGDQVMFQAIDAAAFEQFNRQPYADTDQ